MQIERIQVDEGFLDGLDLEFAPGLNVLIGPRGSGKTSVIELIRFCLDVPAITEAQDALARKHALAILGSGTVSVTLRHDEELITVSRTAEDESPRSDLNFPRPLVISQNEIEEIGLQAESRVELLDRFVARAPAALATSNLATIQSLTRQIASLRSEIDRMRGEASSLTNVGDQIAELTKEQKQLSSRLAASAGEQKQLASLNGAIAEAKARQRALDESLRTVDAWRKTLAELFEFEINLEPWPGREDWLAGAREKLDNAQQKLGEVANDAAAVATEIRKLLRTIHNQSAELDGQARDLRKKLEAVQQGAGDVSRRIQNLETQKARLVAIELGIAAKQDQIRKLVAKRDRELDAVDELRASRFEQRKVAAQKLNAALRPHVHIEIEHAARHEQYISAIVSALRGSGSRYNVWGPKLAAALSPRELIAAVEANDPDLLTISVERLSREQAVRLLSQFDVEQLGNILAASVEDDVSFSLFDGSEYRPTPRLSTGQRCTVVLPILLRQTSEPLIVDQPEDHLDNAFIVETLVRGITMQKSATQLICSTHNANIPVLGGADLVILMGSDGNRAFVDHAHALEHPDSVKAITSIMEGGLAAFQRRARFYDSVL